MEGNLLIITLLTSVVSLLILFFIIQNASYKAVKAANGHLEYYAKMHHRAVITQLHRSGCNLEELKRMLEDSDEQFWERIQQKESLQLK